VGEETTRTVNVRILAASNRDLKAEVAAAGSGGTLLPAQRVRHRGRPVAQHKDDIQLLAAHFLRQTARRLKVPLPKLTQAHLAQLHNYDWPGNVREMQNLIERALILAQRGPLRFDLPPAEIEARVPVPGQGVDAAGSEVQILTDPELRQRERANIMAALAKSEWRIHGPGGTAELLRITPARWFPHQKAGTEKAA